MYHSTESAQIADLVLPAASWGEKEGVFINSERRIGRTRKVRNALSARGVLIISVDTGTHIRPSINLE